MGPDSSARDSQLSPSFNRLFLNMYFFTSCMPRDNFQSVLIAGFCFLQSFSPAMVVFLERGFRGFSHPYS